MTLTEQQLAEAVEAMARAIDPVAWRNEAWGLESDYQERAQQDARRKAEAALTAALPIIEPQWQPIETAPKDGTKILIITRSGILSCRWDEMGQEWGAGGLGIGLLHGEAIGWMPIASGAPLSQIAVNLVIAARETMGEDGSPESLRALDTALMPFAGLVPYENDPGEEARLADIELARQKEAGGDV